MTMADHSELADLADAALALSREIEFRHAHREVIALTLNERLALRAIDRHGEIAPSDLAVRLGLQRSNLSTALRGLEAKGLVTRTHDDHDGRGVLVRSTPLAAQNLERLRARWSEVLGSVAPGDADLRATARVLREMADALVEQRRLDG
jgi:DNA-binding MarR family transcriptional regulator